jgi:hypothetical protein
MENETLRPIHNLSGGFSQQVGEHRKKVQNPADQVQTANSPQNRSVFEDPTEPLQVGETPRAT